MISDPVPVFDLDDTLYPESDFVAGGFRAVGNEISRQHGIPDVDSLLFQVFSEGYRGNIFDETLRRLGIPCTKNDAERLVHIYRDHQPKICLFPDAASVLARLAGQIPLAMISDGWERVQRRKLQALGVSPAFSPAIFTFDLGPDWHKPSRLAFDAVSRVFGGDRERYIYIADNAAKDFGGAVAAGWRTVHIVRINGVHNSGPAGDGAANYTIYDLRELLPLLGMEPVP